MNANQPLESIDSKPSKFKWLKGSLLIGITIYLFLSLSDNAQPLVGSLGVNLREKLTYLLGQSAWLLPLACLYHLIEQLIIPVRYRIRQPPVFVVVGWLLLAISCPAVAYLAGASVNAGVVGLILSDFLTIYIGSIGALVLFCFALVVAFGLIVSVTWLEVFHATGSLVIANFRHFSISTNRVKTTHQQDSEPAREQTSTLDIPTGADQEPITNSRLQPMAARQGSFRSQSVANPAVAKSVDKLLLPSQQKSATKPVTKLSPLSSNGQPPRPKKWLNELPSTGPLADKKPNQPLSTPPLSLLNSQAQQVEGYSVDQLNAMGRKLEVNLEYFNIKASVEGIHPGPVVTLFEIAPAPGVKVGQIVQLSKDLARALSVKSVRIVEIIDGKPFVGVEIPNQQRETVNFYQLLASDSYQQNKQPLSLALGKDIGGKPVVIDLAKTPHLLVAGTTGSGKSVGINSMILSLLFKSSPEVVKLILIDPKMLELSVYEGIAHLLTPVVTDVTKAQAALKWSVAEMERRYRLMSLLGVRNISGFNEKVSQAKEAGSAIKDPLYKPINSGLGLAEEAPELEKLSYIVVVIDEFADLMMVVGKQVEELIARLAQKARAAGIHLILATQRPSVNIITGLIKANVPSRLSFQVSTKIDSRTILDQGGAEQLLGLGDMLYLEPGKGLPLRIHGAFVSDDEVHKTVDWLKQNYDSAEYHKDISLEVGEVSASVTDEIELDDELFDEAWQIVTSTNKVSISRVQRQLRIGYNRAARLVEQMQAKGLVSAADERGVRQILASKEQG